MFDLMPFGRNDKNLMNYFDNFEKNLFGDFTNSFAGFRTDILDKGDKYVLDADLPGFSKEDINIDIENDYLTITAQHSEDKEDKQDNFVRRERRFGSFSRSFNISDVKADEITASYQNGVLELSMPKQNPQQAKNRKIEIQ